MEKKAEKVPNSCYVVFFLWYIFHFCHIEMKLKIDKSHKIIETAANYWLSEDDRREEEEKKKY